MESKVNTSNIEEKLLAEINRAEFRGDDFLDCVDVNLLRTAYQTIKEHKEAFNDELNYALGLEGEIEKLHHSKDEPHTLEFYEEYVKHTFGNCHMKGCEMLAEACYAYDQGETSISNIYIDLGHKFNCPSDRVERNIRHYIARTMKRERIQPFSVKINKYTNKEVVSAIVDSLYR